MPQITSQSRVTFKAELNTACRFVSCACVGCTLVLQACPNSVDFIVVRDKAIVDAIDVKRLPKRPSPPRFGKKLSAAQKERASHVCVDCGYVYTLPTPFLEQGEVGPFPQPRFKAATTRDTSTVFQASRHQTTSEPYINRARVCVVCYTQLKSPVVSNVIKTLSNE